MRGVFPGLQSPSRQPVARSQGRWLDRRRGRGLDRWLGRRRGRGLARKLGRRRGRGRQADRGFAIEHCYVLAVALEGNISYTTKGLRVVPSFSCGRARWTRVAHADHRFARVAHRDLGRRRRDLRAREASITFGGPGGGTQGARCDRDGAVREIGAGVRDLRSFSWEEDLRCDVVIKALGEQKATDAGGAPR